MFEHVNEATQELYKFEEELRKELRYIVSLRDAICSFKTKEERDRYQTLPEQIKREFVYYNMLSQNIEGQLDAIYYIREGKRKIYDRLKTRIDSRINKSDATKNPFSALNTDKTNNMRIIEEGFNVDLKK